MPLVKGYARDGYIVVDKNVDFRGSVLGAGGGVGRPRKSNYYFVDDKEGNDDNSGKSWEGAFATIGAACTAVTARYTSGNYPWTDYWNEGDTIFIAPGLYEEALTAVPYGTAFVGTGNAFIGQNEYSRTGVLWKPTTTNGAITQSILHSNSFHNIRFRSSGAGKLIEVEEIENVWFEDCVFQGTAYGGATATTTHAVYVEDSWMFGGMRHCFISDVQHGLYIDYNGAMTFHSFHNVYVDDLTITGTTETGIYLHVNQNPSSSMVKNSYIGDKTAALALGIDDNTGKLSFHNVYVLADDNDPSDLTSGNYSAVYLNGALEA